MLGTIYRAFDYRGGMLVFSIGLLLRQSVEGAPTFSVLPGGVSNLYAGTITLQVTGLTNGETVSVEKYLDVNSDRIIDSADWLVQAFRLTDGQATVIAAQLLHVAHAMNSLPLQLHVAPDRQQHGGKNADNGNRHEQFDEREGACELIPDASAAKGKRGRVHVTGQGSISRSAERRRLIIEKRFLPPMGRTLTHTAPPT